MRVAQNNIPLLDRGASLAGGIIKFWDRGWEDSLKGIPVTSRLQEMPSPPHSKLCPWASWNCWHHTQEPQACRWCPKWEHSPLPPNVLTSWCWRVVGGTNMLLSLSLTPGLGVFFDVGWALTQTPRRWNQSLSEGRIWSCLKEPGRWQVTWVNVWQQLKSVC